jgi:cell division protein FtsI (penicillin-binding protein 3)/stage V sporulation protein D (sporulation-specific penicillin-binding protein)
MAVSFVFAFCLTAVSCKLIWIQLVKQESYRAEAIRCHTRGEPVPAQRGSILDVSGRVLAQSMPLIEVHLDGKILAQEPKELPVIASILGVSAEWLKGQVDPENRYLKVAEGISVETEGKLKASKLRSVITERKTARNYPNGSETAQILGYVNSMEVTPVGMARPLTVEVGEAGVEKSMDRYLRGVAGERRIIQDVKRREIPYFRLSDRPARDGYHVVLTVDQGIQHVVEKEADALVEKYQPETLQIVVLRPSTGEILAMVSRPTFDPNQRATYESWAVKNRILADTYEPGSTFKIVTVAAALNENVADLNSTFFCENGEMFYGGSSLKDHEDYGMLTLREVVAKSSNIGMAKLAIQLGEEKVHEYARLFGFGQKTQRGEGALPGEEGGLLRPIRRWSKLSITRIPMGYEVAATNLQMALAYGAIANGGKRMEPRIIKAVVDRDNRVVLQFLPKVVCQAIQPEAAEKMVEALRGVVSDQGTAEGAQVPGYEVAGKTGTARKVVQGDYAKDKYRASFIGFLPAEKPEFLVSIMVDEPKGKVYYGGLVAGPAFKNIATQVAEQLHLNRGAVVARRSSP